MATKAEIVLSASDKTAAAFASARSNLSGLGTKVGDVRNLLGSLGVALSAGAFTAWAHGIIDGVDALNDVRDATGATIENISALEDIAARTGTSFEAVGTALVKFNGVLKDAKPGTDAAAALKALGLNIKELKALDPADALQRTAIALAAWADDGNKARIIQELFGKSLKEVAPFLHDLAEAGKLNAKVTAEQAQQAETFNKQLFALSKNSKDAARTLISDFLPALVSIAKAFADGGIRKGLDEIGNQLFDWEGNAQRKLITNLTKELEGAQKRLNFGRISILNSDGDRAQLKNDVDAATARLNSARAQYVKSRVDRQFDGVDLSDAVSRRPQPRLRALPDGLDGAADKKAQDELKKQLELLNKLAGVDGDYQEQLQRLYDIKQKGNLTDAQYVKLVEQVIQKQPIIREQAERQAKADQAAIEQREQYNDELGKAQATQYDQAMAGLITVREYARGIDEQNERTKIELGLVGQSTELRQVALQQYQIELDLKRQILAIDENLALTEKQRESQRLEARDAAGAASQGVIDRYRLGQRDEVKKTSEESAKTLHDDVKSGLSNAFRDTGGKPLKSLGDAVKNTLFTRASEGLAEAITTSILGNGKGGGFGGLAGLATDWIKGLSGSSLGSVFTGVGAQPYDGGGYTGNGARMGGVDGKGGFPAILHPRETVIDHTKGQRVGGDTIIQNNNYTVGDVQTSAAVRRQIAQGQQQSAAAIMRSRNYRGVYAE